MAKIESIALNIFDVAQMNMKFISLLHALWTRLKIVV